MCRRISTGFKAAPCTFVFLFLLASCGGGGMGGYGGSSTGMGTGAGTGSGYGGGGTPAPTIMFTSPAQAPTIHLGQAVKPLFAPLSAALLADGDLIVENSDINIPSGQMPNLAIEVSPVLPGGFVGQPVQLDASGTPGALFGIAATVDSQGNQIIYFNDDNANTVIMMMAQ